MLLMQLVIGNSNERCKVRHLQERREEGSEWLSTYKKKWTQDVKWWVSMLHSIFLIESDMLV
jgi:hypothetical protein